MNRNRIEMHQVRKVPEVENGSVPKDWWIEDLRELDVYVYNHDLSHPLSTRSSSTGC
ncbi:hypothetical protein Hanom_Chr03g00194241 [Helianthus anomalus]